MMMRDYSRIDNHLDELAKDVYPQPVDPAHTRWAEAAISQFAIGFEDDTETVLDVGCGEGFCQPLFANLDIEWTGVTLGKHDYEEAKKRGTVYNYDASFMPFEDNSYDMIFARHILEHSPMPLITLMEWHRIASKYLILVFPAPEYWLYYGKNHYHMMNKEQLWWLLARSGWKIYDRFDFTTEHKAYMDYYMLDNKPKDRVWHGPPQIVEYRILCTKGEPQTE